MTTLSVGVVGAGIGSLTAALALSRRGHGVTVIERRTGFSEVGAGLQLSPNASRILFDLDLGAALVRVGTEPERVVVRALRTGREIGSIALGRFARDRFGAPALVAHRADLQRVLLDAVRSRPGVRLLMGRSAETVGSGVDAATVTVLSTTGATETLQFDVIVGADGLWSSTRRAVGDEGAPLYRGCVAWRATIERADAPPPFAVNETGLWLGAGHHLVHYPVAGGRLLNIVAIERRTEPVEGWAAPGDPSDLQARFATATPLLRALVAAPAKWLLWPLFDHPAGRLAKGRIALLGDAGHPVLPFLAQGAALAIEDAACLATHLGAAAVPDAVRAYERERLPRVRRVQSEARRNGRLYHAGGLLALGRNLVMRSLGAEGMARHYDWLYGWRPDRL